MADSQIQVSSIVETPRRFALASHPEWWSQARELLAEEGGEMPRHIHWQVDLEAYRIGRRLLFRGDLRASLGLSCAWCVEPIDFPVQERVELLLEPTAPSGSIPAHGIELDPEDGGVGRYAGEALDFGPVILEILALAWPMQARASDDCPEGCPNWRPAAPDQEGAAVRGANRPFAGLDRLLRRSGGEE